MVSGHQRTSSNPFKPTEDGSAWEMEKKQFISEMGLMREQLKSETVARLESQVSKKKKRSKLRIITNGLGKQVVEKDRLEKNHPESSFSLL